MHLLYQCWAKWTKLKRIILHKIVDFVEKECFIPFYSLKHRPCPDNSWLNFDHVLALNIRLQVVFT